ALVAYGAAGAGLGLGAGMVAALAGGDGFGLALAGVGTALAYAVARFRIIRDLFLEQVPHGLVPLAVQAGALAVVALGAVLLWRVVEAALGGDHPDRPLPLLARRGPQGRPPARPRRHAGRGARARRLPHGRLRRQRERLAGVQLPAGVRRVPLPGARFLLCGERAGGAARALQRAPPGARALPRPLCGRASLLPAGRGGD